MAPAATCDSGPTIIGVRSSIDAARSAHPDNAAPVGKRGSDPRDKRNIDDAPPCMPGDAGRKRRDVVSIEAEVVSRLGMA